MTVRPVVAVFGVDGMAGTAIDRALRASDHTVSRFDRQHFDIADQPISALDLGNADIVVNAAGVINRHLDSPNALGLMKRVNTEFPHELTALCAARGIPVIHLSTDCVFDGSKGLYVETDTPIAKDAYGQSKAEGEPDKALVLRTSIVGPETKNFYSLMCWFLAQEDECRGYVDHFWNGITTVELARVIVGLIEHSRLDPGVRHLYADDLTKYELLQLFQQAFDKRIRIIPFESGQRRDMRLRTNDESYLSMAAIAPTRQQIEALISRCDSKGIWRRGP